MNGWKELYGKKQRPGINELSAYLPADVMALFSEFANHLAREYGLHCAPAVYTITHGWVFRFGRSAMYLVSGVTIADNSFYVESIRVNSRDSLKAAVALVDKMYADGFQERLELHSAQKSAAQSERTKRRREREKKEIGDMAAQIDKEKFNKYRWSAKLSRQKLKRLYENDAKIIYDEELVDDIGYALYARCLQGRDERALISAGKLKCHGCGEILSYKRGLIECGCGSQYLFRDYMRSFRTNNMPSGSATHIFNKFIETWPRATTYPDKMRLVDGLVHEFHINLVTGVKGRFVGINLIEGTKKQIEDLLLSLAYSEENKDSQNTFARNLTKL